MGYKNRRPIVSNHQDPRLISFGRRVRQLRKQRAWSQEYLANAADLDRSCVSSIERGEQSPGLLTVYKLSDALQCGLVSFFETTPGPGLR
jgi:transcriptional regulator with XRE-family HTH domain